MDCSCWSRLPARAVHTPRALSMRLRSPPTVTLTPNERNLTELSGSGTCTRGIVKRRVPVPQVIVRRQDALDARRFGNLTRIPKMKNVLLDSQYWSATVITADASAGPRSRLFRQAGNTSRPLLAFLSGHRFQSAPSKRASELPLPPVSGFALSTIPRSR
jgi:hypothetical protein